MKLYCQKCGSGTSYNMQKPKFCQSCGASFSGEVKASKITKRKITQPKKPTFDSVVSEEEREPQVPQNINKLEFDTVGTLQVKGTTVADLAGTLSPNEQAQTQERNLPQVSKEDFLKDFQKEAGTSRPRK